MNRFLAVLPIACAALIAAPVAAQTIGEVRVRADAGDANSQYVLGEAYRTGQGVTPDRDQAIAWFRKAAQQGDVRAADGLGMLLFSKGDRGESIPLLQAAANRRDLRALYLLGTAHFNGDGVAKDMPRAYAEMRASANGGLPQAIRSLAMMEPYITPADRTAASAIQFGTAGTVASLPPRPAAASPAAPMPVPARTTPASPAIPSTTATRPAYPATTAPQPTAPATTAPSATSPAATPRDPAAFRPVQTVGLPPSTPAPVPPPPAPPTTATASPRPMPSPPPVSTTPPKPATIPAPAPTAKPVATAPAEKPAGRWRVQLGALVTQAKAEDQWTLLVRKVPTLSHYDHVTVQAGAIWRLQATGLADRAEGQSVCTAVSAKNMPCIVLGPAS